MDDPYEVLNIRPDATTDAIEKAYRSMASRWHPDLHPAARRTQAEEQMKRINAAAELLLDAQRRIAYDRGRQTKEASSAPLVDSRACHFHPARPRLHYCVCCRNALCVECTQIVAGWPWCATCATTSKTFVSTAPVYGDTSIAKELLRREQYQLSTWSKINLALSIIALALWLFGIWGPGFVYTPFAVGLVILAVITASSAFHFALLRTTALFWNARKWTLPQSASPLLAVGLTLLVWGGGDAAYRAMQQVNISLDRQQNAVQRQVEQSQQTQHEQDKQKAEQNRVLALKESQQALITQFLSLFASLENQATTGSNAPTPRNVDFTQMASQDRERAMNIANDYLGKYPNDNQSEVHAMFLSFFVYLAIESKRFGDENNLDTQVSECLNITKRPAFKIYCLYYQAKRIDENPQLPLNNKVATITIISEQMDNINVPPTEQNVLRLREKVKTLLKKQSPPPKQSESDKGDTQNETTPKLESSDSQQHPPVENLNRHEGGN